MLVHFHLVEILIETHWYEKDGSKRPESSCFVESQVPCWTQAWLQGQERAGLERPLGRCHPLPGQKWGITPRLLLPSLGRETYVKVLRQIFKKFQRQLDGPAVSSYPGENRPSSSKRNEFWPYLREVTAAHLSGPVSVCTHTHSPPQQPEAWLYSVLGEMVSTGENSS